MTQVLRNSIPKKEKGVANGVATLDSSGHVPASQLPSYVDDVIEVTNFAALPVTGETGKIYVTLDDGKTFRWTGSIYAEISNLSAAEVKSLYESNADTNALTDTLLAKVNGIEAGATADQTDSEIATAYGNQVSIVSQAEAEAGAATTVRRWTAERVAQAIAALAGNGTASPLTTKGDLYTYDSGNQRLPVGGDGDNLVANSGEATGLKWKKNNLSATTAPTATDDSSENYEVGSIWIDVTNDIVYVCVDATASSAVWAVQGASNSIIYSYGGNVSTNLNYLRANGESNSSQVANNNDGNVIPKHSMAASGTIKALSFYKINDNVSTDLAIHVNGVNQGTVTTPAAYQGVITGLNISVTAGDHVAIQRTDTNSLGQITVDIKVQTVEELSYLEKPSLNKTLTLDAPTASDDITIFRTDVPITVQEVIAVSTGTTPSTTYQLKHATDRNTGVNNALTTSSTATSRTTGNIATLDDATIPANSWIWLETTAASGTDVILSIDIRYTED